MKERLDVLLVKRNLAASREKAKAIIMSGIVYVDGQKEDKAGTTFPEEATSYSSICQPRRSETGKSDQEF